MDNTRTKRRMFRAVLLVAALTSMSLAGSALAAPPANTAAPTITGNARVGETLTAQNGTWSNNPTASSTSGSAATRAVRAA